MFLWRKMLQPTAWQCWGEICLKVNTGFPSCIVKKSKLGWSNKKRCSFWLAETITNRCAGTSCPLDSMSTNMSECSVFATR